MEQHQDQMDAYARLFSGPLALKPEAIAALRVGQAMDRMSEKRSGWGRLQAARHGTGKQKGRVAVLNLFGVLTQRDFWFGHAIEPWGKVFDSLVADPGVEHIVINADSPGGSVSGVRELAGKIHKARKEKNIVAISNSMMCSAAYWIGAAASKIVCTPSGEAGSIGVYCSHTDWSAFDEKMGVKTSLISAGKYKTEGNPYEPLTPEARERIQGDVDQWYDRFTADVARFRGVTQTAVKNGYGEGRSLTAERARAAGLVDEIRTFEDTLASVGVPRSHRSAHAWSGTSDALRAKQRRRAAELEMEIEIASLDCAFERRRRAIEIAEAECEQADW